MKNSCNESSKSHDNNDASSSPRHAYNDEKSSGLQESHQHDQDDQHDLATKAIIVEMQDSEQKDGDAAIMAIDNSQEIIRNQDNVSINDEIQQQAINIERSLHNCPSSPNALSIAHDGQTSIMMGPEKAETPKMPSKAISGESKANKTQINYNSVMISSKKPKSRHGKSSSRPPIGRQVFQSTQKSKKDPMKSARKNSEMMGQSQTKLSIGLRSKKQFDVKSIVTNSNNEELIVATPKSQVQPLTAGIPSIKSNGGSLFHQNMAQADQEETKLEVDKELQLKVIEKENTIERDKEQTNEQNQEATQAQNVDIKSAVDDQANQEKAPDDTRSHFTQEQLQLLKSFEDAIIQKARLDIEREEQEEIVKKSMQLKKSKKSDRKMSKDGQSSRNINQSQVIFTPKSDVVKISDKKSIKNELISKNSLKASKTSKIVDDIDAQNSNEIDDEQSQSQQDAVISEKDRDVTEVDPDQNAQNDGQDGQNPLEDGAEEASEESFDPEAEYKKLQAAEEERMKDVIAMKLQGQMSEMFRKMKDYIIVQDKSKSLPPELPKNLIYWHRCQTEVCQQDLITNEFLLDFYQTEFKWHDDAAGEIGKVSDELPFFRSKPIFIDEQIQYGKKTRYVNKAEEKILKENNWPQGFIKYDIEGKIMVAKPNERSVFFNAKFESGNLRQVFKTDPKKSNLPPGTPPDTQLPREVDPAVLSQYNLYLKDDTNSDNSLTQWFYFGCTNIKAGTVVKLNMLNLMKDDSLYSLGMQPFVYSQKRHLQGDGVQWHREGFNIQYYFNDMTIRTSNKTMDMEFDTRFVGNVQDKFKKTSTLSFSYEFKYDNDIVFFAHFAPYSYSDVFRYLCKLELNEQARSIMRIDYICKSLGGIPMYGLTITNNIQTDYITQEEEIQLYRQFEYEELDVKPKKKKLILPGLPGYVDPATVKKTIAEMAHEHLTIKKQPKIQDRENTKERVKEQAGVPGENQNQLEEEKKEPRYKKYFFLTSRVHPGETNSQYMMQGCIEFLMSDHPVANEMRNHFIFKIIPILNTDGTVYGNYRASLLGVDLNRRWKNPSRYLHPTIYHTKSLIRFYNQLGMQHDSDSGGVVFSCDMHGHSRNMDIFQYACKVFGDEVTARLPNQIIWSIPQNANYFCPIFNTAHCKMAVEKDKETTARIVLFKDLGILNSYTLEATFFGSEALKKPRGPGQWIKAIDETMQDEINQKYKISDQRTDIHIEAHDLLYLGHDWLKGIHFASLRQPLGNYWFDEPRRVEEIRQKEAAIIAAQEKQLEEIRAKQREEARLAKIAERERQKAERAAEKAKKQLEERIARLKAKGIEITDDNINEMERIEEEVLSDFGKKKRKKKKRRPHGEFAGWDDDGKKVKRRDKSHKYEEIEDKDGNIIKIKNGRKSKQPMEIKVENKRKQSGLPQIRSPEKQRMQQNYDELNRPRSIENGVQDDINIIKQAFEVRNSRKFLSIKPGQVMGLGDHLMMQYQQLTQRQQHQQQSMPPAHTPPHHNLLAAPSRFQAHGFDGNLSPNMKGSTSFPLSQYKNKMIDLVDQILVNNNGPPPKHGKGLGSYQQSLLFPQYGTMQRNIEHDLGKPTLIHSPQHNRQTNQLHRASQRTLAPAHLGQHLPSNSNQQQQHIDNNAHKLRQVSQLMNEMVRNNQNSSGAVTKQNSRHMSPNQSEAALHNHGLSSSKYPRNGGDFSMPGIHQNHISGGNPLSQSQLNTNKLRFQNDSFAGSSLPNPQQPRYFPQNITEELLAGWNKEAQSHSLLSKDFINGKANAASVTGGGGNDNTALGLSRPGNNHSRNSLNRSSNHQQHETTLKSVIARNLSKTDSKKYSKQAAPDTLKIHQNRGNITIDAAETIVLPQNLSIIDEKVLKLNGHAINYAQGKNPDHQLSRQQLQAQKSATDHDPHPIVLKDQKNLTTPTSLEQVFQKAKQQEIERRQKDTSFQQRKHISQRLQHVNADGSASKQRNLAITHNSNSRTSSSNEGHQREPGGDQFEEYEQQSDVSPLVIRKSAYPKVSLMHIDDSKTQLETKQVQRTTQKGFNRMNKPKSRPRLVGSKMSRQRGGNRAYRQRHTSKPINHPRINANSSEEDFQQYLQQRRNDIDYKENVYNETSDDEVASSGSNMVDDHGDPYPTDNFDASHEHPAKEDSSALDKYTYHKKENMTAVGGVISPLVFSAEQLTQDNLANMHSQNKLQKSEHVPELLLGSQARSSFNKYSSFINSKSPQPALTSLKPHQINFNNGNLYPGKTPIDEINNQKLMRNQRAIITKPPGLHKLCNFGPKSLNRQKSNDGLRQSVVLLKNPSQSHFSKGTQGTLFQRQKNSVQQDASTKNVLLNSGENHWLGPIGGKPSGAVVILGNNNSITGAPQGVTNATNQGQVDLKYKFHSSSIQHKNNAATNSSVKRQQEQTASTVLPQKNMAPMGSTTNNHKQKETAHSLIDNNLALAASNMSGLQNVSNSFGFADPRSTKSHNAYNDANKLHLSSVLQSDGGKIDGQQQATGPPQITSNHKSEYASFSAANQQFEYLQSMQKQHNYQSQNMSMEQQSPNKNSAQRRYKLRHQQQQHPVNRQAEQRQLNQQQRGISQEDLLLNDKNSQQPTIFKNQLLQNITSSEVMAPGESTSKEKQASPTKIFRAVQIQQSNLDLKNRDNQSKNVKLPEIPLQANVVTRVLPHQAETGAEQVQQFYQSSKQRMTNQSQHVTNSHRSLEKIQNGNGGQPHHQFQQEGTSLSFLRSPGHNLHINNHGGQPKSLSQIKNSKLMLSPQGSKRLNPMTNLA